MLAHVSVADEPDLMLLGLALSVTVGAAATGESTETVTDWLVVPPDPVQARE